MSRKTTHDDASDPRSVPDAGDPAALERLLAVRDEIDLAFATAVRDSIASVVTSDPVSAHRLSSQLLQIVTRSVSRTTPNRNGVLATVWRTRAETSAYSGKLKDAKAAYANAVHFAELHGDPALLGQILVGQIGLLASLGNAAEAQRLVPLASRLLADAEDSAYLARLHMNLGMAAWHREDFQGALREFASAANYFDQVENPGPLRIGLEMNRGIIHTELSQVAEARQAFLDVEKESRRLGLTHFVAQAQFNRGFLEGYFGDYRSALSLLARAEEAFRSQGALELISGTELARAEIYLELGMAQEARELARAAASGYDREEMALDAALSRFAEARAQALLREFEAAASLLRDLDAFYRDRRIGPRRALVQLQLARVLVLQKDLAQARVVARRALSDLSRLEIITGTARARTLLAEIELMRGRPKAGLSLLEPVLEDIDQLPIGDRIAAWHLSGVVSDALGDRSQAKRWLDQAVRAVEAQRRLIPGVELRASAFEGHVRVYRDRIAHALRARKPDFETLLFLVESARARAFRERHSLRASEPRSGTASVVDVRSTIVPDDATSTLAPDAAISTDGIGDAISADSARDATSADSAGDAPSSTDATDHEADSVRARLGSLVARMERLQYDSDRAAVERLMPDLRRQISELERRLMSTLRRRSVHAEKDLLLARGGWNVSGSSAVERTLSEGEVLVEYFVLSDRILALVLGDGRRSVVELEAAPDALRPLMQSFHAQLESLALTLGRGVANLPFLRRAADLLLQQMHEALLRPLEIEDASRLVIVPHRFLHQIPFECLRTKSGYLVDRCVVRRTPSADFLLRNSAGFGARAPRSDDAIAAGAIRGEAGPPTDGMVVLSGMVDGGPAFVGSELEAVREVLNAPGVRVLRDAAAADLLDAFRNARWIHLSTHGAFRGDNPLFSRLSTRGDALFLVDLLERTIDSELVVLSACNSGQVFAGEGDDLSGVAHGFLAAGAQNLVASIWRVHDRATRDWMVEFYRELSRRSESSALPPVSTGEVGDAVRTASIRTRELWDHPFFWGAFCLYG